MSRLYFSTRSFRRRGLSYLEVLIAAAIGLVGTLGAVALFPVAFLQLQRGLEADNANAIGESAVNSAQAIGLGNSKRWVFTFANGTNYRFVDDATSNPTRMDCGFRNWNSNIGALDSFCIDPRFVAELTNSGVSATAPSSDNQEYWKFPYQIRLTNSGTPLPDDVRMWRLSLYNPALTNVLSKEQARLWFRSADDLIFNREVTDSSFDGTALDANAAQTASNLGPLPAWQRFITNNPTNNQSHYEPATWQRRDYMAEYEWIATLVPKFNGERTNIVNSGEYVMSVVVFHNRRPNLSSLLVNHQNQPEFIEDERIADVSQFLGNGIGGGDIEVRTRSGLNVPSVNPPLLTDRPASDLAVRENDWVMLGGMMYEDDTSTGTVVKTALAPLFQWYRVTGAQNETTGNMPYYKQLTLQGADWPIKPAGSTTVTRYVENTQITFVSGVVGVFERTIRLD